MALTAHMVAYTARNGINTEQGVARVLTDRNRPSWQDCHAQIPGYVTGKYLGPTTSYTLRYTTETGEQVKAMDASLLNRIGPVVARAADRGEAWDIAVTDVSGADVTFDFACFCE
ncbi:MAG: hypothetical protein HOW97_02290 [Catenulispora sp.]|nr:hypothetical protein [Catenulispora sp.]